MVCTGLRKSSKKCHVIEKSLKVENLWDILEKSWNFLQNSLRISESSLKKISFIKNGQTDD